MLDRRQYLLSVQQCLHFIGFLLTNLAFSLFFFIYLFLLSPGSSRFSPFASEVQRDLFKTVNPAMSDVCQSSLRSSKVVLYESEAVS